VKNRFQNLPFKCKLHRYIEGATDTFIGPSASAVAAARAAHALD
jgi:hypothetical protein